MPEEPINKIGYYRKAVIYVCLIAIMLFFIVTNIIWLALDAMPPTWDPSYHMAMCKAVGQDLRNIFKLPDRYPPFFYLTTVPLIKIIGAYEDSFVYGNFLYVIILVLSIFGIGKLLFDEWVGIGSASLVLLYPFVFWMSRQCYLDFALLAVVSLAQYLILKSEGGIRKYWNIGLGAAIGCALLIKTHALIFLLPTWIMLFLYHYNEKDKRIPLPQTLIIMLLIALPWYVFAMDGFIKWNLVLYSVGKLSSANKNFFTAALFYNKQLYRYMISHYLSLALFIGFIFFLIFDRRWKVSLMLISWILIPYIALVLWPNKDPRFILPILPAFAIFTVGGISRLPKKMFRVICYGFLFSIAVIQFVNFSFRYICFFQNSHLRYNSFSTRPSQINWKIKEVLDYFSSYTNLKKASIFFLTDSAPYFNAMNFMYYTVKYDLPFQIIGRWEFMENVADPAKVKLNIKALQQCNFIVTKEGYGLRSFEDQIFEELNGIELSKLGFKKIKEFDLPDTSKAIIYENIQKEAHP